MNDQISIILPAKNEARALEIILPKLRELYPVTEIIVIDDGSIDDTINICTIKAMICYGHTTNNRTSIVLLIPGLLFYMKKMAWKKRLPHKRSYYQHLIR